MHTLSKYLNSSHKLTKNILISGLRIKFKYDYWLPYLNDYISVSKRIFVTTVHRTEVRLEVRRHSPSSGTTVRVTTLPASLISWTMSLWESSMMERPLTAEIRSPTCSRPHLSVGLPSIMRPILCGITEKHSCEEEWDQDGLCDHYLKASNPSSNCK